MQNNAIRLRPWILYFPFVVVVAVWIIKEVLRVGVNHLSAFQWMFLVQALLFVVGGVVGNLLVNADKYLARYKISIPGMEQFVTQWSRAIRNVLTCGILGVVGIWIVSSAGAPFGWGVVLGLQLKLFAELLCASEYSTWYWVFARPFSLSEHKIFLLVWAGALLSQLLILV